MDGRQSQEQPAKEISIARVVNAITGLQYGHVLVKIHQGKVVEMEIATKERP